MSEELQKQETAKAGFIRAYGMFWRADQIDWFGRQSEGHLELLGRYKERHPALRLTNFWNQQGIYVLYNDHGPYYVGRTAGVNMGLGKRLRQHHGGLNRSPHKGKWDRFSWFGWRGVLSGSDERGLQNLRKMPKHLLANSNNTVQDIESLLIQAMGTRHVGNARDESFVAAVRWEQVLKAERDHYLEKVRIGWI